jgi:hypothetical protein
MVQFPTGEIPDRLSIPLRESLVWDAGHRQRKNCPPHGPHLIEAIEDARYVTRCLTCGLAGPEREGVYEAKLAFDKSCN